LNNPLDIDFRHADFNTLLHHWLTARQGRTIPTRSAIDALAFVPVLPDCWIYRLEADGEFYCTLAGENVRRSWSKRLIGRPAGEVVGADYRFIKQRWLLLLSRPALLYSTQMNLDLPKKSERLVLPVADADGVPRQILGCSRYEYLTGRDSSDPSFNSRDVRVWDAATLTRLPDSEIPW